MGAAAPAHAEVCDKVAAQGTWLLPVVLVAVLAGLTAFVATRRWAWSVLLVAPVLPSPLLLVDWEVYPLARAEGCAHDLILGPAIATGAVTLCAVTGLTLNVIETLRRRRLNRPPDE